MLRIGAHPFSDPKPSAGRSVRPIGIYAVTNRPFTASMLVFFPHCLKP